MDQIVNDKAKKLCDIGACCSMAQARRVVMSGAFERVMEKAQQNAMPEKQTDEVQPQGKVVDDMQAPDAVTDHIEIETETSEIAAEDAVEKRTE